MRTQTLQGHIHFLRMVLIQDQCLEVRKFFLFPQILILLVIVICSFFFWILFTYWKDRWLTVGLSLQVSTILSCSPVCSDVFSLTFGFLPGLCSLHTPEQHSYDGYSFMAFGFLLDPFGRRRYVLWVEPCLILSVLPLTSVPYSVKQAGQIATSVPL